MADPTLCQLLDLIFEQTQTIIKMRVELDAIKERSLQSNENQNGKEGEIDIPWEKTSR